ncbi:MAG: DUF2238 domain-containing protein [Acidobacteria bacterium]|nr:DUF2238 domain-containing protein [Acidobacteriota bacterium]
MLENLIPTVFVGVLAATFRLFQFSRISYTLIFIFLCLHTIGAHYTYSRVPYDLWFRNLSGVSISEIFGLDRNQYDRFGHFTFGLLMFYPAREVLTRIAKVSGFWGYYLPLTAMLSLSGLYELMEMAVAIVLGGELGHDYIGAQGDLWDAQKDMAMAICGGITAMAFVAFLNHKSDRASEHSSVED